MKETADMECAACRVAFLEIAQRLEPRLLPDLVAPGAAGIEGWANKYNISAPWVLEQARATLELWEAWPESAGRYWAGVTIGAWIPRSEPFTFTAPSVDLLESEAAKTTIQNAFARELDAYMANAAELHRAAGWKPVTPRPREEEHLEWLVRYQVLEQSFSEIARSLPPVASKTTPRQTVSLPVRKLARIIGLPLRPGSAGGRPRNP